MTLGQIAFIFMNVVATFSSNAAMARARSADHNDRDLVQCAIIVLGPEWRIAWSISPPASHGMSS
jgi:hypothetical protein